MPKIKKVEKSVTVIEQYHQALAAAPQNVSAQCNLGWGYYGDGQWEAAGKAFEAALELDPNFGEAYYGLGLTRKAAGARAEAVQAFEKAIMLAANLEDQVRGNMLARLARGQINVLQSGAWNLAKAKGE